MRNSTRNNLSNARLRVLAAVGELGGEHVTISQLAEHLGGHPNAARPHLGALAHDGLITVADVPGKGPGRRPRGHSLTDAGRKILSPGDETIGLAGAFASYLVQTGHGKEEAREIGRIWGENEADALDDETKDRSVDAVVEVLDILGFDPARLSVTEGEALVLRTCPLLARSATDPSFMCEIHQGLIDGVLRRVGASEGITLLPFAEKNGCRVEIDASVDSSSDEEKQSA